MWQALVTLSVLIVGFSFLGGAVAAWWAMRQQRRQQQQPD